MDKKIEDLVLFTKEKYGLHEYYLHRSEIYRSTTNLKDTEYTLSMEWFPNHIIKWDDDTINPDGTACIEIDIHTRKAKRIIFSKGVSNVAGMTLDTNNRVEIIKWVEKETGLTYGRQFELWKEEEREFHFKQYIDGIAVSPSGYIEVKLDMKGRLTLFSIFGQFSSDDLIKKERYTLSLAQVELLAQDQLKLVEFPNIEKKKFVPAFAIEEIYIKNNDLSTLPFVENHSSLHMDKVIEWESYSKETFQRKIISVVEDVTPNQAFQCEPHPDLRIITDEEIKNCIINIKQFFSQQYPNDSGKWILVSLYRDKGYIHATLTAKEQKERAFKRKLKLFIDSETYQVLNYMDNKIFLEEYMELVETEEIKVTKEEAFNYLKSKGYIEITPYYVYDFEKSKYILCGKLDSQYAVKANTGEVVHLNDL